MEGVEQDPPDSGSGRSGVTRTLSWFPEGPPALRDDDPLRLISGQKSERPQASSVCCPATLPEHNTD